MVFINSSCMHGSCVHWMVQMESSSASPSFLNFQCPPSYGLTGKTLEYIDHNRNGHQTFSPEVVWTIQLLLRINQHWKYQTISFSLDSLLTSFESCNETESWSFTNKSCSWVNRSRNKWKQHIHNSIFFPSTISLVLDLQASQVTSSFSSRQIHLQPRCITISFNAS